MPIPLVTDPETVEALREDHDLVDMHSHTRHSDGLPSPARALARSRELDVRLAVTDHNLIDGAMEAWRLAGDEAEQRILPGVEITTAERVHLLVLFRRAEALRDFYDASVRPWRRPRSSPLAVLPRSAADLLEDLQRFGDDALTSAAHPFSLSKNGWMTVRSRYDHILALLGELDAVEALNGQELEGCNQQAAAFARDRGLAVTAGSDAHTLKEIGQVVMAIPKGADLFEAVRGRGGRMADLRPPGNWRQIAIQIAKAPYYARRTVGILWPFGDGPTPGEPE